LLIFIGLRNSSRRISPGWMEGGSIVDSHTPAEKTDIQKNWHKEKRLMNRFRGSGTGVGLACKKDSV
jgi:molybdate-binding protein